jgi:regulation of enolase protein 1 (concanavalin A-like superfamily)
MLVKWYNESAYWEKRESIPIAKTEAKTDFWRRPDRGYVRDSGNFYYLDACHD